MRKFPKVWVRKYGDWYKATIVATEGTTYLGNALVLYEHLDDYWESDRYEWVSLSDCFSRREKIPNPPETLDIPEPPVV